MIFKTLLPLFTVCMIAGCSLTDKNNAKELVIKFSQQAFVERDPVTAANKYISEQKYIQHNPHAADGKKAFNQGFAQYILSTNYKCDIKRVIAEGDLVLVHSHCKENAEDLGTAVMDIFKVEDDKIVEHWDVEQKVPENSENENTMF